MVCSAFNLIWPTTEQLVPMLLRILFFISGLFFSVVDLPASARDILSINPLTHVIEMMRQGVCGWLWRAVHLMLLCDQFCSIDSDYRAPFGTLRSLALFGPVDMIKLVNLCKYYRVGQGVKTVLNNVNAHIEPGRNIGILGAEWYWKIEPYCA